MQTANTIFDIINGDMETGVIKSSLLPVYWETNGLVKLNPSLNLFNKTHTHKFPTYIRNGVPSDTWCDFDHSTRTKIPVHSLERAMSVKVYKGMSRKNITISGIEYHIHYDSCVFKTHLDPYNSIALTDHSCTSFFGSCSLYKEKRKFLKPFADPEELIKFTLTWIWIRKQLIDLANKLK